MHGCVDKQCKHGGTHKNIAIGQIIKIAVAIIHLHKTVTNKLTKIFIVLDNSSGMMIH